LIDAYISLTPQIINAMIAGLPRIVAAIIAAIPQIMLAFTLMLPKMVISFIDAFVAQIPYIASSLVDGILSLIPGASVISGGGGGGILDSIGSFFGFAQGGMVPSGFPNDTFPAKLSSGEAILSVDTVDKLESFLNGSSSGQNVTINIQIGEQQLANVLVNLNRRGFRIN
jgi:hypothetical protein